MAAKHKNIVWRDRKRNALGLPWSFTVYELGKDRLFMKIEYAVLRTGIGGRPVSTVKDLSVLDADRLCSRVQRIHCVNIAEYESAFHFTLHLYYSPSRTEGSSRSSWN